MVGEEAGEPAAKAAPTLAAFMARLEAAPFQSPVVPEFVGTY
ncbi:MAG: hypothetical protein WB562_08460 [Candidatus Sulfotelmatobacter sp.]